MVISIYTKGQILDFGLNILYGLINGVYRVKFRDWYIYKHMLGGSTCGTVRRIYQLSNSLLIRIHDIERGMRVMLGVTPMRPKRPFGIGRIGCSQRVEGCLATQLCCSR